MILEGSVNGIGDLPPNLLFRQANVVASVGRGTPSSAKAPTEQQGLCALAADAIARRSPAAAQLVARCAQLRAINVAAGKYYADALSPNDAAYRVALTNAGEAIVSRDPALAQVRARIPMDPDGDAQQRRGFTIAQGVKAGLVDPAFVAFFVKGQSNPLLVKGFTDALTGGGSTQASNPDQGPAAVSSVPRGVIIAGGVGAALALGLIAYKLTR
jgi:hypothetical protein